MRIFMLLFLAEAWAAPPGGVERHAVSVTQLIFPLINFLIFLYLLKRFLLPLVKAHLRLRREQIVAAVKEAEDGMERAGAMVQDYRSRLARREEEIKRIREALSAEGEREKVKLLREAEGLATKINSDADFLAGQEVRLAKQQVREEIARIAQAAADKVVQSHLTSADQKRLIEEFLSCVREA
jgi:F-type H+-transporting ATPase subunit b